MPGVGLVPLPGAIFDGRTSGAHAISLAASYFQAAELFLLGFDYQHTGGRRHWFGDHPPQLRNADNISDGIRHINELAKDCAKAGIKVVNCSRESALTCFERGAIDAYFA